MSNPTLHVDMPAGEYHDPELPSLSASLARTLYTKTPAHAKEQHPRLAADYQARYSDAMDTGTAIHEILLGEDRIEVIGFDSWRTREARGARDHARSMGRVPMLAHKWDEADKIAQGIKTSLAGLNVTPMPFTAGKREQTVTWVEDGVNMRARMDWLRDDCSAVDDLKTTGKTANPEKWARFTLFNDGYDIQAAFYTRAVQQLTGKPPVFRFVVAETSPPYAVSVVMLSPEAMHQAQAKVDLAVSMWRECLRTGVWPGYDTEPFVAHPPAWQQKPTRDLWAEVDMESVPF